MAAIPAGVKSSTTLTRRTVCAAGAGAAFAAGAPSWAQAGYPTRPVKVIVTYTAASHPPAPARRCTWRELFTRQAGLKALYVPYKCSTPALTDLMGCRVDIMFDVLGTSIELVRAGKLRALAVTSLQRSNQLPQVPSLNEQALPGFDVTSWFGFFAPANTPREVVTLLNIELARVAATPDACDKLAPLGMEPVSSTSDQLRTLVQSEQARWRAGAS